MTFPYVPSGGILQQAIDQFKKSLPSKIEAATLKKLGVAPSNEGYVINVLKFLGVVDSSNDRTAAVVELFSTHGDAAFAESLSPIVREKYAPLFDLRGEDAWTLDRDALITFFRGTDKTSAVVGARQAVTFLALSSMAGKRNEQVKSALSTSPRPKSSTAAKPKAVAQKANSEPSAKASELPKEEVSPGNGVALTVRIEINLPANGSQSTYDNIFKSIKENLLKQDV